MAERIGQKLKLLYLTEILRKKTDEEHPLNATELCKCLAEYGITAERKAIYNDIENLIAFGYDIVKTRTPRSGFFMASREFELPEIYLLTDAVQSANFITPKKTRELVSKLDKMLSENQTRAREQRVYFDSKHKCNNEEIYYNIDTIRQAIEQNKKIKLRYTRRELSDNRKIVSVSKEMTISPYALIWQNDHYYLVGNNAKYDNLLHLRIDRMHSIKITDEKWRHFSEVCQYKEFFNVSDYADKSFNMYGGEVTEIELKCDKSKLEQIIDRFSRDIFICKVTDTTFNFSTKALISDGLISWLLQSGNFVEVVSPLSLRQTVSDRIDMLRNTYNK